MVAGQEVATGGRIGARLSFLNEGAVVQVADCEYTGSRGSFTWTEVSCQAVALSSYDSIRLMLGWVGINAGFFGIDEVSLSQ
ncbi:MAG: hypothetical protein GYB68_10400 [Chloroflexi bacterium]|nr:hypothetical protein [Chloroflexota bacterium]